MLKFFICFGKGLCILNLHRLTRCGSIVSFVTILNMVLLIKSCPSLVEYFFEFSANFCLRKFSLFLQRSTSSWRWIMEQELIQTRRLCMTVLKKALPTMKSLRSPISMKPRKSNCPQTKFFCKRFGARTTHSVVMRTIFWGLLTLKARK